LEEIQEGKKGTGAMITTEFPDRLATWDMRWKMKTQKLGRLPLGNNVVYVSIFMSSLLYLRKLRIESAIFPPACNFASWFDWSACECINGSASNCKLRRITW
jgi:hypothetical protein